MSVEPGPGEPGPTGPPTQGPSRLPDAKPAERVDAANVLGFQPYPTNLFAHLFAGLIAAGILAPAIAVLSILFSYVVVSQNPRSIGSALLCAAGLWFGLALFTARSTTVDSAQPRVYGELWSLLR